MANYTCWGCESTVSDQDVFPQGTGTHRLNFCRACNKVYSKFQTKFAEEAKTLDEKRAAIREKVRVEIFQGKREEKLHVLTDVNGKPIEPGQSQANAMRAELSAGGETGVTHGELEPALEAQAAKTGRVRKNA